MILQLAMFAATLWGGEVLQVSHENKPKKKQK